MFRGPGCWRGFVVCVLHSHSSGQPPKGTLHPAQRRTLVREVARSLNVLGGCPCSLGATFEVLLWGQAGRLLWGGSRAERPSGVLGGQKQGGRIAEVRVKDGRPSACCNPQGVLAGLRGHGVPGPTSPSRLEPSQVADPHLQ